MGRPKTYDPRKSWQERFWDKVSKSTDYACWVWTGAHNSQGYGELWVGPGRRMVAAHRLSYRLHKGEFPNEVLVLHSCDNRRCVNPNHLFLGSYKDNTQDMMTKGRNKSRFAKTFYLSIKELNDIVSIYATGKFLEKEIAEKFGVSRHHVCMIVRGKVSNEGRPLDLVICQRCGFERWDGVHGHPFGGKRTPPKTLWCLGDQMEVKADRRFVRKK